MRFMLPWYYPYKNDMEWAENKLFTTEDYKRLIANHVHSDTMTQMFISRIYTNTEEINHLVNLLYDISIEDSAQSNEMLYLIMNSIHKVCTKFSTSICEAQRNNNNAVDTTPLILRLISLICGIPFYNYTFLTDDYYKKYAEALVILYGILKDGSYYFDDEHITETVKRFMNEAAYQDLTDTYSFSNYNNDSPFIDFMIELSKPSESVRIPNIKKLLYYLVSTEKFNDMTTFISNQFNFDVTEEQINDLGKILLLEYSAPSNSTEPNLLNDLSQEELYMMLASFLKSINIDIEKLNPVNSEHNKNVLSLFKIISHEIKYRFDYEVYDKLYDVLRDVIVDPKAYALVKMYYKGTDVTAKDLVDVLEINRVINESEPATEAKKVDYSAYAWDDDDKEESQQEEDKDTDNKKDDKTSANKNTNTSKDSKDNDDKEDDDEIPNHGSAKLKGAERSIKRSNTMGKTKNKIYMQYARYKQQEQKIDSQVSKVVLNAGKVVAGVTDEDVKRRIIGNERFSVVAILKRVLATCAVFSFSKIGALCLLVVRVALGKFVTDRERRKIIADLESEIEIIDEKISDARGDENKEAKYALMRTKNNLQNTIKKIKYGGKWNQITLSGIKDAKSAIKDARGES